MSIIMNTYWMPHFWLLEGISCCDQNAELLILKLYQDVNQNSMKPDDAHDLLAHVSQQKLCNPSRTFHLQWRRSDNCQKKSIWNTCGRSFLVIFEQLTYQTWILEQRRNQNRFMCGRCIWTRKDLYSCEANNLKSVALKLHSFAHFMLCVCFPAS